MLIGFLLLRLKGRHTLLQCLFFALERGVLGLQAVAQSNQSLHGFPDSLVGCGVRQFQHLCQITHILLFFMVNTDFFIHQSDKRLPVRQVYTFVRRAVIHGKGVMVGTYGADGHLPHGPLYGCRPCLSRKFQCGVITDLFRRPGADTGHAQEAALHLAGYCAPFFVLLVENDIHQNPAVLHTHVFAASYRGVPVIMVVKYHGVLSEFFQIGPRGQHAETVSVYGFVMYAECICFAHCFSRFVCCKIQR